MSRHKTSYLFNQRIRSVNSFSYKNLMSFKYSKTKKDKYLYLMVSKKYGTAVQRNQLKRWVRILYHQTIKEHSGLGLMVRPTRSELLFDEVCLCFKQLDLKLKDNAA